MNLAVKLINLTFTTTSDFSGEGEKIPGRRAALKLMLYGVGEWPWKTWSDDEASDSTCSAGVFTIDDWTLFT